MQKYKTVTEFLNDINDNKRSQVEELRETILKAGPQLKESIKWNAPNYAFNDEDRITFNIMNKQGLVKLVLHMGATHKENKTAAPIMQDASGLLQWNSDIRGIITFEGIDDARNKLPIVENIIKKWLAISAKM